MGWKVISLAVTAMHLVACFPQYHRRSVTIVTGKTATVTERGVDIEIGETFFRCESLHSRDLSVLAAALYKKKHGCLRVLDAFSGIGSRGSRYLAQAGADFVHCNDANEDVLEVLERNLRRHTPPGSSHVITHGDAHRVTMDYWMRKDYLDIVDCDCFGLGAHAITAALHSVRAGGMIYVTSTDGRTASGKAPHVSLASYGAWALPRLFLNDGANEQGLRLLIGHAAHEASKLNLQVTPLFSLYSPHGPVYRTMLKVDICRSSAQLGEALEVNRRFVAQCERCGQSAAVPWDRLGAPSAGCRCGGDGGSSCEVPLMEPDLKGSPQQRPPLPPPPSVRMSGPLWTGALHDREMVASMRELAEEWSWGEDVCDLLDVMEQEIHPDLPSFSLGLHTLSRIAGVSPAPRHLVEANLEAAGFLVRRTHLDMRRGMRTNASVAACVEAVSKADANAQRLRNKKLKRKAAM
mmetsp:Transcript_45876/g.92580  ORF Transcript_45876/g.92580 Transcript_45876/m.92580 type:complete len:464 (+) Transcript_45876:1-1392(+)